MQRWEYRTTQLEAVPVSLTKSKGWRLKKIDEQEQPDWKKTEVHTSVTEFCNLMGQQGWELVSVSVPERFANPVILYFKRPLER